MPLINFDSEINDVIIGDFIIRKYKEQDSEYLKKIIQGNLARKLMYITDPVLFIPDNVKGHGLSFLYEFTFEVNWNDVIDNSLIIEKAVLFLNILRLFKTGNVGINSILIHADKTQKSSPFWMCQSIHEFEIIPFISYYYLEKDNITNLNIFYDNILKYFKTYNKTVNRSIRWFNKSYIDRLDEDKFIDFYISLESLYKCGGYKLSLRCAYNISRSPDNRENIVKNMEEASQLRNKILHGGTPEISSTYLLHEIETYARDSLILMLKSENQDTALSDLDKKISRGNKLIENF